VSKHLVRVEYSTDYGSDPADSEYPGNFSGTIPDRPFLAGWQVVGVDWSTPGVVEVTFLVPGDGHRSG
jgi:hypothetical protein